MVVLALGNFLRRLAFAALFLVFVATSCSSGSTVPSAAALPKGSVVSARIAHGIEQDAIRSCMRQSGFEYLPPAYTDRGGQTSALGRVKLDDADIIGYGGVFRSVEFLTPGGEPGPDIDPSEFQAYANALNGDGLASTHDHFDGSPDDHDHDDDQDHSHDFPIEGCYAVGRKARQNLVIEEGNLDLRPVIEKLAASTAYADFSSKWSDCLVSQGYEARDSSPVGHSLSASSAYFDRAQSRFVDIFSSGGPESEYFASQYAVQDVLTTRWFREVISRDAILTQIYEEELRESRADQRCRNDSISLIADLLADP